MKIESFLEGKKYIASSKIREFLLKHGYKQYKCENCLKDEWLGDPIPLEVHHIDGNSRNNDLSNLQILCPNCHAKTDNYSGKNARKKPTRISSEEIVKAIPQVCNIRQLLKYFGLSPKGGNYDRIRQILIDNPSVRFKITISKKHTSKTKLPTNPKKEVAWPTSGKLQKLLWEVPTTHIAQSLGVSDKAVEKRAKKLGLSKPPRGYWQKQ